MNCSDGLPCVKPCRKMVDGAIKIADLPEGCPLLAPDPDAADKSILDPWRGRMLSARSVWGLADLAAGALRAAEKEETLAGIGTGGKLSESAYKGLAKYREDVAQWKRSLTDDDGEVKKTIPPPLPTDRIYLLFVAMQNAAGKSEPVLDVFARLDWVPGVKATLRRYLAEEYATPPLQQMDESKAVIYKIIQAATAPKTEEK